jgi:hypothetical protein
MRFNRQIFLSATVVVLLAIAICFRFFGDIIMHPNEFLFGADGDGLKNYYSVAYQVIHGDGLWFNGMLYPYGDHIIFADGQPLLTKVLSWFVDGNASNGGSVIGIMNLLMIFSLVLCAWCMHRLLIWNMVGPWFSVPFALCIAFLSPQVARFSGHYALGYTFFVPLSWLLIAAFTRYKLPWITALAASLIVLAFGFLHPYYLFIFVIFLGAVLFWDVALNRFQFKQVQALLPRLFTLVVPLVVFMVYQKLVDPYTDRPSNPAGVYSHMATFQSIFTPTSDPFRHIFHSYFFRLFIPTSWEGSAYIGMVSVFIFFASVVPFVKRVLRRGWRAITRPMLAGPLRQAFVPGVITLLFAMGLFHKLGLYWLADYILPIKQFRSLGRVAWIFYYVIGIWTVFQIYVFYRLIRINGKGKYTYIHSMLVVAILFFWTLDAIVNIKYVKEGIQHRIALNSFSNKVVSEWENAGVIIKDHQAILPIPIALIGSEKIGLEKGKRSSEHTLAASFSTGLPIIGGAMSRTSLEVTEKTAQLVADSLLPRPILDDMQDGLKLLLLKTNEETNLEEERLIGLADKVFENEQYSLYSVSVDEIILMYAEIHASAIDSSAAISGGVKFMKPINSFEVSEDKLWNQEAYDVKRGTRLLDSVFEQNENLNLSYWVKVDPMQELTPNRVYSVDEEWKIAGGVGSCPNLLDGWLLVSENLNIEAGKHHVFLIDARPGTISRILLRNADETLKWKEYDGSVFVNNIPFPN